VTAATTSRRALKASYVTGTSSAAPQLPPWLLEAAAVMLLLASSCLAGVTMARTSIGAGELSAAVLAPGMIGIIVVSVASIFRIGRSRPMRARILLGTMFLLLLGQCGYGIMHSPELSSGATESR
jgi:hypothetical protein